MKATLDRRGVKVHLLSSFLQSFKIHVEMIPKETTKYLKESWNAAMGSLMKVIYSRPERGPRAKGMNQVDHWRDSWGCKWNLVRDILSRGVKLDQQSSRPFEQTETNFSLETLTLPFIPISREREPEKGWNFMGERKWVMDAMSFKYLWDIQKR